MDVPIDGQHDGAFDQRRCLAQCLAALDGLIVKWTDALVAPEYRIEGWHPRPVGPFAGTAWGYMLVVEGLQDELAALEDDLIHRRQTHQQVADAARAQVHAAVLELRGKRDGRNGPSLRRRFLQRGERPATVEFGGYCDNVRQMAQELLALCERCSLVGVGDRPAELRVMLRVEE